MLLLTSTSDLVQLITSAAVETDVQASWVDNNAGTITPGRTNTQVSTATTTTVVGSPGASTQRNVKHLSVMAVGGAQNVTLQHTDGTTVVSLFKADLLTGECVVWTDGVGFQVLDAKGAVKNSSLVTRLDSYLDLLAIADPSAPAAGNVRLYGKNIAERIMPKWIGPAGVDVIAQPMFGTNNVRLILPGSGTTAGVFPSNVATPAFMSVGMFITSGLVSTGGSFAQTAIASTNLKTQTKRTTMTTGSTSGAGVYVAGSATEVWRGNAAGLGGFFFLVRWGMATLVASSTRVFVGLRDVQSAPTNVDYLAAGTTAPGRIGLSINTNTGNWQLNYCVTGTAPTVVDLGASFPVNTTDVMELVLFAKPNDSSVYYRVGNLTSGVYTTGTLSANIPASTTFLSPLVHVNNNTAASSVMEFIKAYLETDF